MNISLPKILASCVTFVAFFVLSWAALDHFDISFADAEIGCGSCGRWSYSEGPGGGGFTGGGGGDGGGGGGYTLPACYLMTDPVTDYEIDAPRNVTLRWVANAYVTSISIDNGIGAITPSVRSGTRSVYIPSTTTYTATVRDNLGRTATCSRTITVKTPPPPPPGLGCINVVKETYNTQNAQLVPVPQFTFKLDGGAVVTSNSLGLATFSNVTAGTHTVTEVDPGSTWELLSVTPANGTVVVPEGQCATVVFKNRQVLPPTNPAPTCTLTASAPGGMPIRSGERAALNWTTTNATSISINQGVGSVTPVSAGSRDVFPAVTTTYTATATGPGGTVTCSDVVTISTHTDAPVCSLNLSANQISWTTNRASSISIAPLTSSPSVALSPLPLSGSFSFNPSLGVGTHTYRLTASTGSSGPSSTESSIFSEGFESGVVGSNGWNVVVSNGPDGANWEISTGRHHSGERSIRAEGPNTSPLSRTISTVGQNNVTFSYWFRAANLEASAGEYVKAEWTADGVIWHTLSTIDDSVDTGDWMHRSHTLPASAAHNAQFAIRFRPNLHNANDDVFIDDIHVRAVGTTTGGSMGETVVCEKTIVIPPVTQGPFCALTIDRSKIRTGESVRLSWTSQNVTGGSINNNVGALSPVAGGTTNGIFPSDSTTYTGTFTGPYGTTTCAVTVEVEKGGGGCQGNCGGGLNQPTVSLFNTPNDQPLAFVSLSQIPYTGFEAGPLLAFLFWLAVALWSAGVAYVVIGPQSMRYLASQLLGGTPAAYAPASHSAGDTAADDVDLDQHYHEYIAQDAPPTVHRSVMQAPTQAIQPTVIAAGGMVALANESVKETLEARAHQAGILLSPEALEEAARLSEKEDETIRRFDAIVQEAIRTIPREDGWVLLSSDRLRSLAESLRGATAAPAPVAASGALVDSAVERVAMAVLSGSREEAFALVRELEAEKVNATSVVAEVVQIFDRLYQARTQGGAVENLALSEKAATVSEEKLRHIIEIFSNALHTTYALPYTGVKIALAQVFDLV